MGKLELSHFTEKPAKKLARRNPPKRDEAANAERFGSLVEGNPFKIAGDEVRRNRRRNARGRGNARDISSTKSSSPLLRGNRGNARTPPPPPDNHIVSMRMRDAVPDLKIDEKTAFPELATNTSNQDTPVAAKDTPTPAAQAANNTWSRNGKDVITTTTHVKPPAPSAGATVGPIRPGWIRLSRNGCEYGPRSEHYERLLQLQQQTTYVIHREFFAKTSRMMNDGYEDDRYDGGFFSDDATSECDDYDQDTRNNSDDDDSDDDY